jgi:hypothetical protein
MPANMRRLKAIANDESKDDTETLIARAGRWRGDPRNGNRRRPQPLQS